MHIHIIQHQWSTNGGKCGLCGDPYDQQQPRQNEAGGKYATGIISAHYTVGQVIDITVDVTANHKGWFEFRLCPNNDVKKPATQACLDKYLLQLADGSGTRYECFYHETMTVSFRPANNQWRGVIFSHSSACKSRITFRLSFGFKLYAKF